MGTRGGSAERSGARGRPCAQDALKAPRMAQEALGVRDESIRPSPRPEAVLSDPRVSGGGVEGHANQPQGSLPGARSGLRVVRANLSCPEGINTPAYGKPGKQNEASLHAYPAAQSVSSPARQTEVWKPPVLSLPERHPFDETRIDDKARWTAACARYLGLVERLCRKYRREFPAAKYGASAMGGLRERLALLQQFGGVPKSVLSLNSVPAEQLEEAVEAFAECFGLTGDAATGHLEGTPSATHLDPAPLNAGTLEVPW